MSTKKTVSQVFAGKPGQNELSDVSRIKPATRKVQNEEISRNAQNTVSHGEIPFRVQPLWQAKYDTYYAILTCAVLGCRRGEALGLQWQDIDFANNTVSIKRAITH